MQYLEKKARGLARKAYSRLASASNRAIATPVIEGQAASDLIRTALSRPDPFVVARLGSAELRTSGVFLQRNRTWPQRILNYLRAGIPTDYDDRARREISNNAGVFPVDDEALDAFAARYLEAIEAIDVLGRFDLIDEEVFARAYCPRAIHIPAPDIEPYYHAEPWSTALRDRHVLVVHPFEESIRRQYERRELLFGNGEILPSFHLSTLKAVVSHVGEATEHRSWLAALEWMCERIRESRFDVAIIGAGAYGLPLAAFVKRLGRKAVHMGGAVQILFGIKGRRWDKHPFISSLYNPHWVRPLASERPRGFKRVENGSYW